MLVTILFEVISNQKKSCLKEYNQISANDDLRFVCFEIDCFLNNWKTRI